MNKDQFIRLNKEKGFHWFDKATIRFFKSRVMSWDNVTGYFISSERHSFDTSRCYTIRKADFNTGQVETVGEYGEYPTLTRAKTALNKLLKG